MNEDDRETSGRVAGKTHLAVAEPFGSDIVTVTVSDFLENWRTVLDIVDVRTAEEYREDRSPQYSIGLARESREELKLIYSTYEAQYYRFYFIKDSETCRKRAHQKDSK